MSKQYRVVVQQSLPEGDYTARIGISVGGERHEGAEFYAMAGYLNNDPNVKEIIVEVCCTLQRHNYQIDGETNDREASKMAQKFGDEWLTRNDKAIRLLMKGGKSVRIRRWSEWLGDPGYQVAQKAVNDFFKRDVGFQKAVCESVKVFSARFKARHKKLSQNRVESQVTTQGSGVSEDWRSSVDSGASSISGASPISPAALQKCCQRYLLEECAVIMNLWAKDPDGPCVLFYPGNMTAALKKAYGQFVSEQDQFSWVKYSTRKIKGKVSHNNKRGEEENPYQVLSSSAGRNSSQKPVKATATVAELLRGISLAEIPPALQQMALDSMFKALLATQAMADTHHANSLGSSTGSSSESNSEEDSSTEHTPTNSPLLGPKKVDFSKVNHLGSLFHRSPSPGPVNNGLVPEVP